MAKRQADIVRGTLDLLVLKTIALEPRHGVGVAHRISQITGGTFKVGAGSLFPALHRLEQDGFIAGEWSATPEGHRAKYLPAHGRRATQARCRQETVGAHRIGHRASARS